MPIPEVGARARGFGERSVAYAAVRDSRPLRARPHRTAPPAVLATSQGSGIETGVSTQRRVVGDSGDHVHLGNVLSKLIYWPLCRVYARHLGDRRADAFLAGLCRLQFRGVHGFWPNYEHPRHFTEKLWRRMLYERNPQLTLFCDKFHVREFVASRIGPEYLVPLLWTGTDAASIPFDSLPPRFVIKANHGCAYNILVEDKSKLDVSAASRQTQPLAQGELRQRHVLGNRLGL